jgi:hypothetical protein
MCENHSTTEYNYIEYKSNEERTGSWWGNLRERENFEDPSVDGRIILR